MAFNFRWMDDFMTDVDKYQRCKEMSVEKKNICKRLRSDQTKHTYTLHCTWRGWVKGIGCVKENHLKMLRSFYKMCDPFRLHKRWKKKKQKKKTIKNGRNMKFIQGNNDDPSETMKLIKWTIANVYKTIFMWAKY